MKKVVRRDCSLLGVLVIGVVIVVCLGEAVAAIGHAVVELSRSDDEKVAATLRPKVDVKETVPIWQRSESKSEENVIDEDDPEDKELLEKAPGKPADWIEETMGAGIQESAQIPR